MAELFILAFLGHLIGEYLLQPTWMAIGKSKKGVEGVGICTVHVTFYSTAVMVMLLASDRVYLSADADGKGVILLLLIAIPHFIIDHWQLGEKWSKLIGGRTVEKTLVAKPGVEREFAFAFYAPVYIAVDNTWHLLCLLAAIKYFFQ